MNLTGHNLRWIGLCSARLGAVVGAFCVLGLCLSAGAFAAYEQVGTFAGSATPVLEEKFSEEVQLGGVGGMAVNVSGAGGVPAGTVYAAVKGGIHPLRVGMFEPGAGGGLVFKEAWEVNYQEVAYERCGPSGELPDGELIHPNCEPRAKGLPGDVDVEVDQTTGNVYVLEDVGSFPVGTPVVVEYSPDGSEVITRFGEEETQAGDHKTTAESPDKIHSSSSGGIAVNSAGDVYVYDKNEPDVYHRLMVFRPQSPGDYAHYVYAGETAAGFHGEGEYPSRPVVDAAGDVYVAGESYIEEYAPEAPAGYPASRSHAICSFEYPQGGIESMTVDPVNGDVFFYSIKIPKRVRRLGPCDQATGKFTELAPEPEALKVSPERGDLSALAFDPVRKLSPTRGAGVLYGGAQDGVPGSAVGKGAPGQSSLGYIFTLVEENPPVVEAESVARVTASSAELHATIDLKGFDTHYVFQYMTQVAYVEGGESFVGATDVPVGGGSLKAAGGTQGVAVAVTGLDPETEYRYRVVASSACAPKKPGKVCEGTPGSVQSFDTFPVEVPGLPDDRGYELVSPIEKHGGEVFSAAPSIHSCPEGCKSGGVAVSPMVSAADGDTVVYEGNPFSASEGSVGESEYIARRDAVKGWRTTNLSPSLLSGRSGGVYDAFNTGLSQGVMFQPGPVLSPEAPVGFEDLYTQSSAEPSVLTPLVVREPPNRPASGPGSFTIGYAGASADGSRIFFAANDALTEASSFAPEAVDGGPSENNLYEWSAGQLRLVNVKPGNTETEAGAAFGNSSADAISSDGSRVFWSSQSGQVYVREDGERTREVPDHTGRFLSASADGSRVLLDDGHLYDLETEVVTDLTGTKDGFQGVVGQGEDLSHVYFVDTAVLDEASDEHGETAKAGQDNLYAWHEGGGARFVATLHAEDNTGSTREGIDWTPSPAGRTAQASPDGEWVAFISRARLTGYDNTGPCEAIGETPGIFKQAPCPEAFLYNASTNRLVCASCDRSGARPLGWSVLRVIGGGRSQSRYLSDEGRLFFDSEDSLVPADTNGGVEDVYEYEPGGVGRCVRQGGCVSLISAGTGSSDSNFLAADPSGGNVFFTTRDRLVGSDKDELIDLYDARENGGIAIQVPARECQGEACPGSSQSPPVEQGAGSFAFAGAGNVLVGPAPSVTVTKPKPRVRVLTRAQKLTRALAVCKKKPRKQRVSCERMARKRYGASVKGKRSVVNNRKGGR